MNNDVEISIPAKDFAKMVKKMDDADNGWDATEIMVSTLQLYMDKKSYDNYVDAYYRKGNFE